MDQPQECSCSPSELMIFPCAGACNVGQLSNDLSRNLSQKGTGKMACIAAVGAGGPMAINAAKNARILLVIDGCPMACAKKILERMGLNATIHILITDIGLKKTDILSYSNDDMQSAFTMTMERLRRYQP